jgi:AraC family transcriptional regulator
VERPEDVPREIERVAVPAARYAVVTHRGHVTGIRASMHAIFSRWLPESGLRPARAPDFEFYHAAFDPG